MSNPLGRVLNVQPGEGAPLASLVLHAFCIGFVVVFVETTAGALFLSTFSASWLPYTYVGTAVVLTVIGRLYAWLEGRLSYGSLLIANLVFLLTTLLAFRLGLAVTNAKWPVFFLMIWVEVTNVLLSLEFWSLAGRMFNVRQGKRLFGLIGAGQVAAGVLGGLAVAPLVGWIGTANLLWLAVAAAGSSLLVLLGILRRYQVRIGTGEDAEDGAEAEGRPIRELFRDRYLLVVFALTGLSVLGFFFADYLYFQQVEARFPDEGALAGFLGKFSAVTSGVQLLFGVFLSGRLLGRFGIGMGLAALPFAIFLGATAATAAAGSQLGQAVFWLVVGIKLLDKVVRTTLEEPSVLILYQPLKPAQRVGAQTTVESLIEPVAGGVAGLLLLLFSRGWDLSVAETAGVLVGIASVWFGIAIWVRREYTKSLLRALATRALGGVARFGKGFAAVGDAQSVAILRRGLRSPHPGQVLHSLTLLKDLESPDWPETLAGLLAHPEEEVRLEVLQQVEVTRPEGIRAAVRRRLSEEASPRLRGAAIRAVCALEETEAFEVIAPKLDSSMPEERAGAMVGLLRHGGIEGVLAAGEHLTRLVDSPRAEGRQLAARVLGQVGIRSFYQPLTRLLADPSVEVRRAAIVAAGALGTPRLWPLVTPALEAASTRRVAATALAGGGADALNALDAAFSEEGRSADYQRRVVTVVGRIGGERAGQWLFHRLGFPRESVRHAIVEALVRCGFDAKEHHDQVTEILEREVEDASWALVAAADLPEGPAWAPLRRALAAEFRQNRDRVLLMLALVYPRTTLLRARDNLRAAEAERRAYALELLDNVLPTAIKDLVFPVLDDLVPGQRIERLALRFPQPTLGPASRLTQILERPLDVTSSWTKACAVYLVGIQRLAACGEAVLRLTDAPDPLVREHVAWTLGRLGPPHTERLQELALDSAPRVARAARQAVQARGKDSAVFGAERTTSPAQLQLLAAVALDTGEPRSVRSRALARLGRQVDGESSTLFAEALPQVLCEDAGLRGEFLDGLVARGTPAVDALRGSLRKAMLWELRSGEALARCWKALAGTAPGIGLDPAQGCAAGALAPALVTGVLRVQDRIRFLARALAPSPSSAGSVPEAWLKLVDGEGTLLRGLLSFLPGQEGSAWPEPTEGDPLSVLVGQGPAICPPWVRALAIRAMGERAHAERGLESDVGTVQAAALDRDPLVRESALWALHQVCGEAFAQVAEQALRDPDRRVARLVHDLRPGGPR